MIACVVIPYFAASIERRDDSSLAQTPLVVGGQAWEPRPLYAFSQEAAQRGVQPGMSLRLAHSLLPQAHFMPASPPRYQGGAGEVTEILSLFTPLVAPEPLWQPTPKAIPTAASRSLPARYTLDLEELPQREALPLTQEMGRRVRREAQLEPALGLANQPFTAQLAAALARPGHLRPVAPGEEQSFLARQSLDFLPLEKETARRLRLMGVRTLGQFAALPSSALLDQFGKETVALYHLAKGEAQQPLAPAPPEHRLELSRSFEPLADRNSLEAMLAQMATTLAGQLQHEGRAAGFLELKLEGDHDEAYQEQIRLRQPASSSPRLATLLCQILGRMVVTTPVTNLTVTAGAMAPAAVYQLSLFGRVTRPEKDDNLFQTVIARHRTGAFYRPALTDRTHPLPEARFRLHRIAPL